MEHTLDNRNMIESGQDRSSSSTTTPTLQSLSRKQSVLLSKQGYRRRHPNYTLAKYDGVHSTTSKHPKYQWETYLENEHERTQLPKEYNIPDTKKAVTMAGLSETAEKNYKKSKPKLSSLFATGI